MPCGQSDHFHLRRAAAGLRLRRAGPVLSHACLWPSALWACAVESRPCDPHRGHLVLAPDDSAPPHCGGVCRILFSHARGSPLLDLGEVNGALGDRCVQIRCRSPLFVSHIGQDHSQRRDLSYDLSGCVGLSINRCMALYVTVSPSFHLRNFWPRQRRAF